MKHVRSLVPSNSERKLFPRERDGQNFRSFRKYLQLGLIKSPIISITSCCKTHIPFLRVVASFNFAWEVNFGN